MPNLPASRPSRALMRRFPLLSRLGYRWTQAVFELFAVALIRPGWQRSLVSWGCRRNLRRVKDPELRRGLTPDYQPMCKRLVLSNGFYKAMQRDNVELVTDAIDHVEPEGVVTKDGRLHELDVLVLATGFDAHAYMRPLELTGQNGVTLGEAWRDGRRAYRTVAVPGFPNFFMLLGPHSPVGNVSLITVAETQAKYVMRWIELWRQGRVATMAPDARRPPPASTRSCAARCPAPSGSPAARAGTSTSTARPSSGPGRRRATATRCASRCSTSSRSGGRTSPRGPLSATGTRPRRTQAERRAATRAALLQAAIDTLVEEGYAAMTTRRVAERAGVSQGTQMHYFPTKTAFVGEALRHLAERIAGGDPRAGGPARPERAAPAGGAPRPGLARAHRPRGPGRDGAVDGGAHRPRAAAGPARARGQRPGDPRARSAASCSPTRAPTPPSSS